MILDPGYITERVAPTAATFEVAEVPMSLSFQDAHFGNENMS